MNMANSETGTQLLARLGARPSLSGIQPHLFGNDGPEPGSVYEFYGGEGTGKTATTLHLIAKCLLPQKWHQMSLCGKGTGVVVVDTEYNFPLFRLVVMMENFIKSAVMESNQSTEKFEQTEKCEQTEKFEQIGQISSYMYQPGEIIDTTGMNSAGMCFSDESIEKFIQDCLTKLHILQCSSSFQLLMSLNSLDSLLSSNPNISLLVLDTVSAYYWIDKCQLDEKYQAQDSHMKPFISVLSDYVTNYKLVLICVKSALFVKKTGGKAGWNKGVNSPDVFNQSEIMQGREFSSSEHVEFLGNSWSKFISHRFIFTKSSASTFTVISNNNEKQNQIAFKIFESGMEFL